jgi:DNA-binding HxlR family transcriptional regulator
MKAAKLRAPRSGCPIASSLDQLGDRWSLVIIRDLLTGKKRFGEFLDSPERIATNILTERLGALERQGFVKKRRYEKRPERFEYILTPKGIGLLPVLQELCRWANGYLPGTWRPPESFMARRAE